MRQVQIHWMIRRMMESVLEIERASFEYPWTMDDFIVCLRQPNCVGMVAENENRQIVGFMVYSLESTRLNLLNFAVHPKYRRLGIGSAMIGKLVNKLSNYKRDIMQTVVRETNLPAQLFFRSQGLVATDVIRQHYEETEEDAFLFRYDLMEVAEMRESA